MEITYYLKDGNSKKETPLYALIYLKGAKPFKFYLSRKILPAHWNHADQKARKTLPGYSDLNRLLEVRKAQINSAYDALAKSGTEPTPEQLQEQLAQLRPKAATKETGPNLQTLSAFFDAFLESSRKGIRTTANGQPIRPGTLKSYGTTRKAVRDFETARKKSFLLEEINLNFYRDFTEFLTVVQKQSANYIAKHVTVLRTLLNEAAGRGIIPQLDAAMVKGFRVKREDSETIFLDENELKEIQDLDLSDAPRLERVRDLFLIGAYTGARFSDWDKITPANIGADGLLYIRAEKTGQPVSIPILPTVRQLFEKYGEEMPHLPTNQKVNAYLKEIGRRVPCLLRIESKTITKGGKKETTECEKWELLSTHTARRSFATNMYRRKVPAISIMALTGHRSEKTFLKYIRLTANDHARIIQDAFNS